jgi:hypothetical protein
MFDVTANAVLLVAVLILTRGQITNAPIYLLAAANVGYFITIILAQVAAYLQRREATPDSQVRFRAPAGLMGIGLVLAVLNAVLLVSAGFAWGWLNILLGVACLAIVVGVLGRAFHGRRQVPAGAEGVV